MKSAIIIAACIGLGTATSAAAEALPSRLELACFGGGAANKADVATVNGWDSNGNFGSAQVHGQRSVGFEDQVNLWIEGDEGRIRMPRSMLPVVRGGEDGWFKIKSIEVSEREIIGSVAVNVINNPKLRVDRYTGAISISGKAGDFSGRCQKYDPATERRAF